jgi:TRAP-type C4-dicarboxylate transport system substrate-binding protein
MRFEKLGMIVRVAAVAGALVLSTVLTLGGARAQSYVMKVTTPTINDAPHLLAKNFAAAVERDSGGRIKSEVYPASQLGAIPRQIEGVQFGAIQAAVIPPEFFVGVDERFEVMAAPGMVDSLEHGQRIAADPAVLKLMLSLGADKGLHGAGMFIVQPDSIVSETPLRHLADFDGKKIRIFASDFQSAAFKRLGVTPVAMTLADVLPALQQGAIDGALGTIPVFVPLKYSDVTKFMVETEQPYVNVVTVMSKKWLEELPADLQKIIRDDATSVTTEIVPFTKDFITAQKKAWIEQGGELLKLPPEEQAALTAKVASIGADLSKDKPALGQAVQMAFNAAAKSK